MSKGRILVVEDDFDISNMLRIYFAGQGYEVQVAPRGSDALAMTRKQLPNLIVLDIMLPDMNGYDVCIELRKTTRTSHIPIIFLTQKDGRSDKIRGLEIGADDYLTKPLDISRLQDVLDRFISGTISQASPSSEPHDQTMATRLAEIAGDDAAFMAELVDTFITAGEEILQELRAAALMKDCKAIARTAHKLKGASAN